MGVWSSVKAWLGVKPRPAATSAGGSGPPSTADPTLTTDATETASNALSADDPVPDPLGVDTVTGESDIVVLDANDITMESPESSAMPQNVELPQGTVLSAVAKTAIAAKTQANANAAAIQRGAEERADLQNRLTSLGQRVDAMANAKPAASTSAAVHVAVKGDDGVHTVTLAGADFRILPDGTLGV